MTTSDTARRDAKVNESILAGKALDGFEEFYAEDVVMQENSKEPRRGKAANRKYEQEFFGNVEEFHGAELEASAVDGDKAFSQWHWDVTLKGVGRVHLNQVAVRTWRDGKVVYERFFYNEA